jgi:hypothetical protein
MFVDEIRIANGKATDLDIFVDTISIVHSQRKSCSSRSTNATSSLVVLNAHRAQLEIVIDAVEVAVSRGRWWKRQKATTTPFHRTE